MVQILGGITVGVGTYFLFAGPVEFSVITFVPAFLIAVGAFTMGFMAGMEEGSHDES